MLLVGCMRAPMTYRLARQGSMTILIPPTQTASDTVSAFDVRIKNARKTALSRTDCDVDGPLLTLHWNEKTAEVRLKFDTYFPEPGNQVMLGGMPQPGVYLASLQGLDASPSDLLELESKGCLSSTEDQRLIDALVERFPLPPYVAYLLRFGSYGITGGLDLNSDFRLQVISPVYTSSVLPAYGATDAPASAKQLIGYETAYYVFTPSQKDDRVMISLASVTETDVGKSTPFQKSTTQNIFPFPKSFGYFRLLFRREASAADHIATIIGATDSTKLNEATKQLESGSVDPCQRFLGPGVTCVTFPSEFGVNPQMRVRVNGKESFVGVAGTVSEAMNLYGPIASVPKTLIVRRQFQRHLIPVKFDPASKDILQFVLMSGDEITWQ
jgi:hypothetical protein